MNFYSLFKLPIFNIIIILLPYNSYYKITTTLTIFAKCQNYDRKFYPMLISREKINKRSHISFFNYIHNYF